MAIDIETGKAVLGNGTGGLSGPAIKPLALYQVQRAYQEVASPEGIPIIGVGGIVCAEDAIEFIIAGAAAAAVGTAGMINPSCLVGISVWPSNFTGRYFP